VTRSLCCQLLDLSNDLFQCARELGRLVGVEFHRPASAVAVELVRPDRRGRKAAEHMIINEADRLHRRVRRGRADKTKAKPFELSGHSD
jgi:hypothetical protein